METSTEQQRTIARYTAGFASQDVDSIVTSLADDIVWEFNGQKAGEGLEAFRARIASDMSSGRAETNIEQFIEDGNLVATVDYGRFVPNEGGKAMSFRSAEINTFEGEKFSRIQTVQTMLEESA